MNGQDHQAIVANYVGALAHTFSGSPGRHFEFIDKVEIIISGSEAHALQLMQFSGEVRRTGRPVIWVHCREDMPNVPSVGLIARCFGKLHVIENCML